MKQDRSFGPVIPPVVHHVISEIVISATSGETRIATAVVCQQVMMVRAIV